MDRWNAPVTQKYSTTKVDFTYNSFQGQSIKRNTPRPEESGATEFYYVTEIFKNASQGKNRSWEIGHQGFVTLEQPFGVRKASE